MLARPPTARHVQLDALDEAYQDAAILAARASGSMTVLGDLAQATGPHAHTDWDRLGTLLSDHGDWQVAELATTVPASPAW